MGTGPVISSGSVTAIRSGPFPLMTGSWRSMRSWSMRDSLSFYGLSSHCASLYCAGFTFYLIHDAFTDQQGDGSHVLAGTATGPELVGVIGHGRGAIFPFSTI